MTGKVMGAYRWRDNADLIANGVHKIGWLRGTDRCLDPTYGLHGGMWTRWRPDDLTTYCREKDGSDFRALPHPDGYFDSILFDPDYVAKGGRSTSTRKEQDRRYGQITSPKNAALLIEQNNEGLTEMARLACEGGIVCLKTQDYVSNGMLYLSVFEHMKHAEKLGLVCRDRFEFVTVPTRERHKDGPQKHARRNHSTLLVFQKGSSRRRPAGRGGIRELGET